MAATMAMVSIRLLSFFCFFGILISQATVQPSFLSNHCMNDKGNYTANSTYQTNLNTLLSNLSSNTQVDYGFYNFSLGENSDQVNAIGLCRGDIKPDVCRSCLNDSRVFLTQLCPNQKEAIGWYDNCMLRYSNSSIFGIMEASPNFYVPSPNNTTEEFNQVLTDFLDRLRSKAASGDSLRKYAAANTTGSSSQTIYGLVQCTPDLSEQECNDCLVGAISECCDGKGGGRVFRPSCMYRYETFRFSEPTADTPLLSPPQVSPSPPPSTNNNSTEGQSNTSRTFIAVAVPAVSFVLLLIFICIYLRLRKSRTKFERAKAETDDEITTIESKQFDFDYIKVATNNFADSNKLGQGGFGTVYMGRLPNGQEIAVKRIVGTCGYMAPEYAMHENFSVKLDVFSFGVLVLEIVCGHKNTSIRGGEDVENLLTIVWRNWRERTTSNIIDPTLGNGSSEMMRCIHIGLLCVQENTADRPTMGTVVRMLDNFSLTLSVPSEPAFFMDSRSLSSMQSSEYSSRATGSSELRSNSIPNPESINEASITELYPR
ncbi:hypothetical protein L6164_032143 [Bauhinia variegata]|uniref:Uncharacterized protein n=1 Tax=Bauhinia variegata TaxID=167791 RepID=A0ACB9KMV8_BAUVA|nr:hypothetical protein L6164_032143 [Bauhinia variegata]